jgi:hypothetical protein
VFEITWWKRLRGDLTYVYRYTKEIVRNIWAAISA